MLLIRASNSVAPAISFSESEKRKFDTDDFTRSDLDSSKFYLHLDTKSIQYAYQKLHAEQVAENR